MKRSKEMTTVEDKLQREKQQRLRALAGQTLEAYRALNEAAADASLPERARRNGDDLSKAGDLLEAVLAELKEMPAGVAG